EQVGSRDWSLVARDEEGWRALARGSSPKQELYVAIAESLPIPTVSVIGTDELGDPGARLGATGVKSVLVVAGGTETEPCVTFFEDPRQGAGELIERLDRDSLERLVSIARDALEFEQRVKGIEVLRRWLPAVDELSRGELDDATGIELLGAAAGGSPVMAVRQLRKGIRVSSAARGSGKKWRQKVKEVEGELSGSAASDAALLAEAAISVGITDTRTWATGRSPDGMLVLATEGSDLPSSLLDVCATILAFASERSADSSATRNNAMLQERARIASVMHEGITQVLTNVAIQMEVLDELLTEPEAARKMLASLRQAVLEALDSLRGAILELNPTAPEWTDLAGGLDRFTSDFAAQWGMDVAYSIDGEARDVDAEIIAVVFGFVQEALTNVRKHAASAHTEVKLAFEDGSIEITVTDNGPGFDTEAGDEPEFRLHQGLGLTRSRINLAGGRFTVASTPGKGTTLKLEIGA
ncbi:MAG: hypothetical protein QOH26_2149, partial [Actinomycetota bacterium]|nr:hypothetical protein [Actinomycetota bacterium]